MRIYLMLPALAMIAGCTMLQPEQAGGSAMPLAARQCFFGSQVSGFTEAGENRVLVRVGFVGGWELTVSPGCPSVDGITKLGIVSRGSDRICPGQPAELLVPRASGSGSQRCLVRNVRKLSDQEFAAAWGQIPRR